MADVDPGDRSDEGAWIFVSHSHQDLRDVRRVRDALEAKGHQPLLFFLKCLGDDAEVDGLICREIEARQFFVLCDSPNARASRWVQQEVRLINNLADKVRVNLSLDGDWKTQLEVIDELSRRATVFFSYARRSEASRRVAAELEAGLRARDYRVVQGVDPPPGVDWFDMVSRVIDEAVEQGFVLVLLSPEALAADFVAAEVQYALKRRVELGQTSSIVPILVDQPQRTLALLESSPMRAITDMRLFDFTVGAFDDNVAELIRTLATL
jgi:hypothetical protein